MGGAVNKISGAVGDVLTLGTSHIAGSPTKRLAGGISTIFSGGTNKSAMNDLTGNSGSGGAPGTQSPQDPAQALSQSGGTSLLTQIALGANVDDAVAGYFGRSAGQDFNTWFQGLSPDDQAAVSGVRNQLTQIQTNTDMRNTAVQKLVNDFPNVVSMTAPQVQQAKQQAGEEFDAASKSYMDYAMGAIAAKQGGSGTVSSGATLAAADRAAGELGLQKLQYQTQQGNQALDLLGQGWQQQYTEANALRGFQQKMLGQGATQGFSATQSALDRQAGVNSQNAKYANQQGVAQQDSKNQMFGALGGLAGTAIGAYFGGPAGAAAGGTAGKAMGSSVSGSYSSDGAVGGYR